MSELFTIKVNGREVQTDKNKKLIRFLRDDLGLLSVKDGCSEGACGTCTILMDGRPVRACIMTTKQADGKELITVEGLSDLEKEAYVYAFGKAGAVQCGFCTPGMIMASKALLDTNKNPTEEDVKKAIRGNLCRCTGYKKILEAVLLVAAILRGDEKIDENFERSNNFSVGEHTFRNDVREFFKELLNLPEGRSLLFHCTQGKDRTGCAAMLTLEALGVSEDIILEDYMLTNIFNADLIERDRKMLLSHGINENELWKYMFLLNSVHKELMTNTLSWLKENYGSPVGYIINELGISKDEIEKLKSKFLEKK